MIVTNKTGYTDTQVLNFIEKHHTLHTKIDVLYVVDGYEVTLLRDESQISETFKGDTLRDALGQMMAAIDLPVSAPNSLMDTFGEDPQ
jgi:HD superfamily phosphohydrolase YqeK